MAKVPMLKTAFSQQPTGRKLAPRKDTAYLSFVRSLPCVVTGNFPVDVAHVSYAAPEYGKTGRGKGQKEDDRWTVPLHPLEHRAQHSGNERAYWQRVGIDPCVIALALWGCYPNEELALLVIEHANRQAQRARRQS